MLDEKRNSGLLVAQYLFHTGRQRDLHFFAGGLSGKMTKSVGPCSGMPSRLPSENSLEVMSSRILQ